MTGNDSPNNREEEIIIDEEDEDAYHATFCLGHQYCRVVQYHVMNSCLVIMRLKLICLSVCDDDFSPSTVRSTSTQSHRRIVLAAVCDPNVAISTASIRFCALHFVFVFIAVLPSPSSQCLTVSQRHLPLTRSR